MERKIVLLTLARKQAIKALFKVIDREESEISSGDTDGYTFSDTDEFEHAREISKISIMEDKTEEEKIRMIDEVDAIFAKKKKEKKNKSENGVTDGVNGKKNDKGEKHW